MSESTADYCARIGSRALMDERQRLRLAGTINRKLPPVGFAKCVQHLLRLAGKRTIAEPEPLPLLAPRPVTVIHSPDTAPKKKRSRWEQRGTSGN